MTTASPPARLRPGATIGVLGGGQLGRMMALAGRRMGYRFVVLDPSATCPMAQVADDVVVGELSDVEAAKRLAAQCDVITLDTEHVSADLLDAIATITPVIPAPAVLRTVQDRLVQKQFLDRLKLPQAKWRPVNSVAELAAAQAELGECIVKIRRAGYDGKGQVRVRPSDDPAARLASLGGQPAVAEEVVNFEREISVILARSADGDLEIYPVAHNQHRNHVLHVTTAPAVITSFHEQTAIAIASKIAMELAHVGVIAVELFQQEDGALLVNEIAPRTHNSGHFTYGACVTSQFEQHVRVIAGQPLGSADSMRGAVMLNLLGDLWDAGPPDFSCVFEVPTARLHLYGKQKPSPGRKMGHVLIVDDDLQRAQAAADAIFTKLNQAIRR